jgi:hypothetical protein
LGGPSADLDGAILTTFRDGGITQVDLHLDRDTARRAFDGRG